MYYVWYLSLHQQKPLIHTHNKIYNYFKSYEEKNQRNFPIGVLELCFLFAVSKEKKKNYTTFHRFFKNISRLYFRIAKKKSWGRKNKIMDEKKYGRPKIEVVCCICCLTLSLNTNTLWHKIVVIVYLFISDVFDENYYY